MIRILLISCTMALLSGRGLAGGQSTNPGGESWSLQRAVLEALNHNLRLHAERENLPIAEAYIATAQLKPNPSLNLMVDHLDLVGTGFSEANGAGPSEYTINTTFPWERGEKRKRRIELATLGRRVTEYALQDLTRLLILDVKNAFVNLLLAQETAALARENLSTMTRILEINQARVDSGDLSEVELVRTKVAVGLLEDEVTQADLLVRNNQSRLGLLTGRPAGGGYIRASGEFERNDQVIDASDLERIALQTRPDLLVAQAMELSATVDIQLQTAQARGDVELGSEFRRQQGINGKGNSLGFFLSIPLPLFDRNQGEIARAKAESRRAGMRTSALRAEVISEVHEALAQYAAAGERLRRIEVGTLAQARQVHEITEYSYRQGEASFIELLDAERAYKETQRSYLAARAEHALSIYRINSVIGKAEQP